MLQPATLKFLKGLTKNNNKPWMDANRDAYDAARADFTLFVQAVIDQHGKNDASIKNLVAKDCLFRINRDIRFAKDKSPYKTNMGASINKGGKKGISTAGYYFHMQPGHSFTGGGIWMPPPEELRKIRQEIDYNYKELKKITGSASFRKIFGDLDSSPEYKLSRIPKGYEADNPAAEYLKLKSFIGSQALSDEDLISKDLVKKTVASFVALQPVIEFINEAMEG